MTNWKSLFGASTIHSLDFIPTSEQIVDGVITVTPPPTAFEEGIKDWQFFLVAQFFGKPPNFGYLYRVLSKLWEKNGFLSVKLLGSDLALLQFMNSKSRDWILENGPWHIKNIPMILCRWEPNMNTLHFNLDKLPLWVQLHHVPLELFTKTGLNYSTSSIGKPLYMDSATASRKRLSYAKVCIEIKAGAELPSLIRVVLGNGSIASITVSVPWKPSCCNTCSIIGHNTGSCPRNKVALQVWQPKSSSSEPPIPQIVKDPGKDTVEVKTVVATEEEHVAIDPKDRLSTSAAIDCGNDFTLVKCSLRPGKSVAKGKKGKFHFTSLTNMFNLLANETHDDIVDACTVVHDGSSKTEADFPSTSKDI